RWTATLRDKVARRLRPAGTERLRHCLLGKQQMAWQKRQAEVRAYRIFRLRASTAGTPLAEGMGRRAWHGPGSPGGNTEAPGRTERHQAGELSHFRQGWTLVAADRAESYHPRREAVLCHCRARPSFVFCF